MKTYRTSRRDTSTKNGPRGSNPGVTPARPGARLTGRQPRGVYGRPAAKPRRWKTAVLAAAAILAFIATGLLVQAFAVPVHGGARVSVGVQLDQNTVAGLDDLAGPVTEIAQRRAAAGGGTLTVYKGAGQKPVEVGHADLAVFREGNMEQDSGLRTKATQATVEGLLARAGTTAVAGEGRDVVSLLQAVAQDKPSDNSPWDVVVYSFGLPTVDPANARVLMAADPAQAVASLPGNSLPDLNGATVHWVFPAAAGIQEPLNNRTTLWRNAFIKQLIQRSGGTPADIVDRNVPGQADPASPAAPAVPNLQDPTPVPPAPLVPETPVVTTLDAGSLFEPDTPVLLDRAAATTSLKRLVAAWGTGRYSSIECVGRVAAFGSPSIGQTLSEDRATVITGLLADAGVPATARGVGSDQPLPGDRQGSHQRSVICTATPR